MEQSRREFLKTAVVGAGWMTIGGGCTFFDSCVQQIANRPMRKDVNTLGPNDPIIQAYKSAVSQMKALPTSDHRNWTNQASIHNNLCPHGNWFFFPWHRWYLTYFERICQKLSGMPDFALPYWNWVKDPSVPAIFFDTSSPLYDSTRSIGPSDVASSSFVGCGAVGNIMNDTNFASFAGTPVTGGATEHFPSTGTPGGIEATPHNYIHGFVCGDMCNFMSPLDPVFWLHHNMVEKCWVEWTFVRNNPNTNDTAWTDRQFDGFFDQDGNPVSASTATPGIGLLLPVLSYQFDSLPVVPSPCAGGGAPAPGPSGGSMAAGWERFNKVKTTSDQNAIKAKAQEGATVRLDVIRRFVLDRPAAVEMGRPTTLPISVDMTTLKAAAAAGQRTFIRFNQMTLNHTGDFSVKVFVNKPDATVETPDADPHFVGGVAFFSHVHEGMEGAPRGNFELDATATLARLGAEGQQNVDVNVVLVPYPHREAKTNSLEIQMTEIQIVKDVIQRK